MSRYLHHNRYLVPACERTAYGQLVTAWLDKALAMYTPANVVRHDGRWIANNDNAPFFEWSHGRLHIFISPLRPSEMLFEHQTHAKAREVILRIAENLLREARTADEKQLRQRKSELS